MSVDILGTSWDQCRSMVQYCFTSTETIRLARTDSPGRPPRLSHSSWTMVLCCFHSLISIQTFRKALTASVDSCAKIKECSFSGVTNSGRVWRKVPESDVRIVRFCFVRFFSLFFLLFFFFVCEPVTDKTSCLFWNQNNFSTIKKWNKKLQQIINHHLLQIFLLFTCSHCRAYEQTCFWSLLHLH